MNKQLLHPRPKSFEEVIDNLYNEYGYSLKFMQEVASVSAAFTEWYVQLMEINKSNGLIPEPELMFADFLENINESVVSPFYRYHLIYPHQPRDN